MATFTNDTRSSSSLTADTRSANATLTNDSKTGVLGSSWGTNPYTWAAETHTWANLVNPFSEDTRN